jgi:hypothetical protein
MIDQLASLELSRHWKLGISSDPPKLPQFVESFLTIRLHLKLHGIHLNAFSKISSFPTVSEVSYLPELGNLMQVFFNRSSCKDNGRGAVPTIISKSTTAIVGHQVFYKKKSYSFNDHNQTQPF